jgi:hypothetical protein
MKTISFSIAVGLAVLGSMTGRAAELSPDRLNAVDKLGYFTPGFKAAVHDLVENKIALAAAGDESKKLTLELPGLQKQATVEQAETIALRQELAKYEHPEETDFVALQARMKDSSANLEDQIALAQAYVWTYPASPHQAETQQFLQQAQKTQADQTQAQKDEQAARVAAYAKMVQRAQAHDLNLGEWRDFLSNKSEDDLVQLIGHPTDQNEDYWIYSGEYVVDPNTQKKVGIQITMEAGRVLRVDEIPSPP